MRRRTFLKLVGLGTGAATLPFTSPAATASPAIAGASATVPGLSQVDPTALRWRAAHGRILVSSDGGWSWAVHTYLGPEYEVERLVQDADGEVRATVGYRGGAFALVLDPDLRSWLTA